MRTAALALPWLLAACATTTVPAPPGDAPYVIVLGTGQDAGLPQIGCVDECCEAARRDPSRRRLSTSLLVVDPRSQERWLFDAGPDLREQVELARGHPPEREVEGNRPPLFEGVFLTHAHIGHYAGLLWLGREAYGAEGQPVFTSERMGQFLRENGPWSQLVETGQIELRELVDGFAVPLGPGLVVEAFAVPHRDEYSDTLAFVVRGPERSLLYVPDTDKWDTWERPLEDVLGDVDVALIDGSFFADGEIPGRSIADIPHPFVSETIERLSALPDEERAKVWFTHLNHTNPAADPDGEAARRIREAGMAVARERMVIRL